MHVCIFCVHINNNLLKEKPVHEQFYEFEKLEYLKYYNIDEVNNSKLAVILVSIDIRHKSMADHMQFGCAALDVLLTCYNKMKINMLKFALVT